MSESINQTLIETTVKQAIRKIQDDPERSTRNLVDMGLLFANGKFQPHFLKLIQQMLENEQSSYYRLIPDVIAHVDSKRLATFGINIGYNSCTKGARIIRKTEAEQGFHIPWSIFLKIDNTNFQNHIKNYFSLLEQGQMLGIYTWILISENNICSCLELAKNYSDLAFVILCQSVEITTTLLDEANELYNIMFVVIQDDNVDTACCLLRQHKFLYSIAYPYSENDIKEILNGNILSDLQIFHPVFTIFYPKNDYPLCMQHQVYEYITKSRMEQNYQTIPFDLVHDIQFIDKIISEDTFFILFDKDGVCYTTTNTSCKKIYRFFEKSLSDILKELAPIK